MNITQTTVDYGLLSELAYLRLESNWFKDNNKSNEDIDDIKNFIRTTTDKNRKQLTSEEYQELTGISLNRKQAILNILNKYEILDFKDTNETGGTASGMQAMFVKEKATGKKVLLFRGTEFDTAFIDDFDKKIVA